VSSPPEVGLAPLRGQSSPQFRAEAPGLSTREALNFEPYRTFIFANVMMDAGKISRGTLMNSEIRSVWQVVFGKPKGDALIEANDLFDIVQ